MIAEIAMKPKEIDQSSQKGQGNMPLIEFVVVEGCIIDELRPGVTSKSSHFDILIMIKAKANQLIIYTFISTFLKYWRKYEPCIKYFCKGIGLFPIGNKFVLLIGIVN